MADRVITVKKNKKFVKKEKDDMDIKKYMAPTDEKPLDCIVTNGGFCGIFRKIACIGDSLSSGEFESCENDVVGWRDYYDYSWGQFIARDTNSTVYNFSRGGMTAKEYCESFATENDFWNVEKRCRAYIIALGVNDIYQILKGELRFGSIEDIDRNNCENNADTFVGWYAKIIQRYQKIQPKAKFFLMTMPNDKRCDEEREMYKRHNALMYQLVEFFDNCYVLDLHKYGPEYNEEFQNHFYLGGHLNAAGYRLTALMVESYIDYIIRHNTEDFKQIGFVGTPFYNENYKW